MSRIVQSFSIMILLLSSFAIGFSNFTHGSKMSLVESFSSKNLEENSISYIEEQIGNQVLFWLNIPQLVQMRATLLSVGTWCYIYMANDTIELKGETESIIKCDQIRDAFDDVIYPDAIELAGSPDGNLGDIDGDPHVTLFLAPLVRNYGDNSVLGYYDDKDDEPNNPYSNGREMFYVDSEMSLDDTINIIIHEFNHMIWGNYEFDEAEFLTEGLANFAIDYSGYFSWVTEAVTNSFLSHSEISLLYFNRVYSVLWDASYGQAYMFVMYLAEQYGVALVRDLVSIPEDGAIAVDIALANAGYDLTFNDVYLDWITACVIDDLDSNDGLYGYESVDYVMSKVTSIGYYFPIEKTDMKHTYYGFRIMRINAPYTNFTFEIENPHPYALGISIAIKQNDGWNVTQSIHTEKREHISKYIVREKDADVFVITSLMAEGTPSDYGILLEGDSPPFLNLDVKYIEGYNPPSKTGNLNLQIISVCLVFLGSLLLITRRRKRN